ncbi:hypothetical protein [Thiolinea disciformis]|uniref:hypothetical protein n=1 Tax=Thiolinea disciformis TaxID=125614 RepID=UPI000376CF66|nr:hypothetical protein [Thiolinea disciformis]
MQDRFGVDLKLDFYTNHIHLAGVSGVETVSGVDNLVQALTLRLLLDQGELSKLGHPRYGSRIRDFLGEPLDRANRELIRRYVRKTLLEDDRVEEVLQVSVSTQADSLNSIQVFAQIKAIGYAQPLPIGVSIDA